MNHLKPFFLFSSPAVPPVKSKSFSGNFHTNRTYPCPLSQNFELNSSSRKNNPSTVDILSSAHNTHPGNTFTIFVEISNSNISWKIFNVHIKWLLVKHKLVYEWLYNLKKILLVLTP